MVFFHDVIWRGKRKKEEKLTKCLFISSFCSHSSFQASTQAFSFGLDNVHFWFCVGKWKHNLSGFLNIPEIWFVPYEYSWNLVCPIWIFLKYWVSGRKRAGLSETEGSLSWGKTFSSASLVLCTPIVSGAEELFKGEEICFLHFLLLISPLISKWLDDTWENEVHLLSLYGRKNLYTVKCCL